MSKSQIATQKKLKFQILLVVMITATVGLGTAAHAQAVKGNGTVGTIPVWNGNFNIGDSMVSQSGGNINVNGGVKASGPVIAPNFNNTLILQPELSGAGGDLGANVIGGFSGNSTTPGNSVASGVLGATIAGGGGSHPAQYGWVPNSVTANWGTIGGGGLNTIYGLFDTIAGGHKNTAASYAATIGGGFVNYAEGDVATVSGGDNNQANGLASVVPGGYNNVANGAYSFAAGVNAVAINTGSFVWNDASGGINTDTDSNQFVARASGGVTFYSAPGSQAGVTLAPGSGSWSSLSDRNVKANLMTVDGQDILERLASLPIATWNYKTQADSVRHMGPMAQDFRAAFGLGEDEKHISAVDSEGVALAAIQALYQEKQQEVSQLKDRLTVLENRLATLESSKK